MKGMPHFRQYPMGDVVNANLEPGEYVLRRNAVNALGVENMELLNHADGAHGALNKLMVSASLVNHQSQDNTSVKTEANGFPIADSPVRQRVDATRQMQDGGPVYGYQGGGLIDKFKQSLVDDRGLFRGERMENLSEQSYDGGDYTSIGKETFKDVGRDESGYSRARLSAESTGLGKPYNYEGEKSQFHGLLGRLADRRLKKELKGVAADYRREHDPEGFSSKYGYGPTASVGGDGISFGRHYAHSKGGDPTYGVDWEEGRGLYGGTYGPGGQTVYDKAGGLTYEQAERQILEKQSAPYLEKARGALERRQAAPSNIFQLLGGLGKKKGSPAEAPVMSGEAQSAPSESLSSAVAPSPREPSLYEDPAGRDVRAVSGKPNMFGVYEGSEQVESIVPPYGMQQGGPVEEEQAMIPAGENIFGQPTEAMTQSQMSDMLLDMMTSGGVGGTIKGVGKALRGAQMEMFPKKASRALSKSRKKSKKPAKEYRETAEERENRLWPDIDLSYRSGDNRLAERFLEDHGYRPYMGQGSREFTYEYTDKGLKTFTPYGGVKSGIEQKTFTDPTFKVLRDWMGYQEGGVVRGYQQGGEVRDVPSGNWGPKGAYNEALRKAREEDMGSNDLKSLSLLEQLRLINAGTGVEPERLEQLNPERPIKRRESIFDSPDSSEYNMPTLEVDPSDYRTPIMRAPSDNYGGEEIQKDMKSIMPYLKSFGRIPTPIQEKERWLYQRLGVSPDSLPPQLKGLAGRALLQRYGSEVQ